MKYIKVLRPEQWVKNVFVLLPLLFSGNLGNADAIFRSLIAVASFCTISSSTYVINDFFDRHRDRLNPEKMHRPIAAGKIGAVGVVVLAVLLALISFTLSSLLNREVTYVLISYFVLSQLYTLWFKHEPFADIIVIAINFVLRAVAGAFAIPVRVSPWLIAGVFFLALFIAINKRRGESLFLKSKAAFQRATLQFYTPEILSRLSILATTALVISYSLFVFFGEHPYLFITLPVALYVILRYDALASQGSSIARHPHSIVKDARLTAGIMLWLMLTLRVLY